MKTTTKKADESAETTATAAKPADATVQETKPAAETAAAVTEPTEKKAPATESVSKADYEALQKRLADAEAIAKGERDLRVTREFIEKARGYDVLPIAADQLGPILKRAADNALTDADRSEIDRVLKAANELIRKGNAFGETGRRGGESESATDRINTLAQTMVTEKKATDYATAITSIMKSAEHADLVRSYQAEQGRRN